MDKETVIRTLGEPNTTAAQGNTQYLKYIMAGEGGKAFYFIRLVNGKVEAYGRDGDFDSTKDPTIKVNVK